MTVLGYDKYRDISKAERPSKLALTAWLVPLLGSTLIASILCGLETAWSLHRWLIFGFVYGNPLIPTYSFKTRRVTLIKPKVVFAMAKSALVAIVMTYVDADVGASHACKVHDWQCAGVGGSMYWRAWAVSFAYNWVRETMCDVRDIDEDRDEGVPTLPATIGKRWTIALLVSVTFCIEQIVFRGQLLAAPGLDSVARQLIAFLGCLLIAKRPREAKWTWSFIALCGLLPATWGQASLAE
jgi:4-hydroxybenzoate polyprenyltransferase